MAYNKKTWKARQGLGLNKFSIDGATPVPIVNQPDSVTQQGDALSAGNLNDLEQRITDAFDDVEESEDVLQSQINQHESRLQNLEQKAGDYSTVQYRGTNAVPTGKAKYGLVKSFVGKSRAWNQLAQELSDTYYVATNATVSYSDNIATITASQEGGRIGTRNSYRLELFSGHTYLAKADIFLTTPTNLVKMTSSSNLFDSSCQPIAGWQTVTKMLTVEQNYSSVWLGVRDNRSDNWDVVKAKNLQLFDLTLIFGSGNEPSTVAEALAQLPALGEYNAYEAGKLVSTEVSGVESRDTSDNVLDTLSLSETVTLRSAGSVADELDVESGVVIRKTGVVDLGDLTWGETNGIFYSEAISGIRYSDSSSTVTSWILCPLYENSSPTNVYNKVKNKTVAVRQNNGILYVYDLSYSDAPTFKTAMSGVYLVYELATPTTESIDPVPDNTLYTEGGGTINTIQTQSPVIDNCLDVGYLAV